MAEELLKDQFQVLDAKMNLRELEQLVIKQVERGISRSSPRLEAKIVRKQDDSSKVYVVASVDHRAADGLSFLQCFSMMQDNAEQNCVPFPKRAPQSAFDTLRQMRQVVSLTDEQDKQMRANKKLGIGIGPVNGKFDYHVSEDLNLSAIKARAKSLDLSVGELFTTAAVTAFSKLDLPEESKPAVFTVMNAFSCHNSFDFETF